MTVITRIAPSPTGKFLHLGNLRTLLYNYLYAKKHGGKFLVRLEDTDRDRYEASFLPYFRETLKWLNIEPDFSFWNPDPKIGSFIQSERDYSKKVQFLVDNGFAYLSFDSHEDIEKIKKDNPQFKYDYSSRKILKNSLTMSNGEVEENIKAGIPHVVRFKVPENVDVTFVDEILGEITINTSQIDDKILIKSNGIGSYHLCNVCDDCEMGVSHVLRGQEWVNSTPFHILLYNAFGWKLPKFAHLPLIMNPDGKGKLSKRTASKYGVPIAPIGYTDANGIYNKGWREEGYDPDALINALALVGWNPGTNQEIFDLNDLIKAFDLHHVHKSGARMDMDKAKWINAEKIKSTNNDILIKDVIIKDNRFNKEKINEILNEAKVRSTFRKDLQKTIDTFFNDGICKDSASEEFVQFFAIVSNWTINTILEKIATYCADHGISKGKILKSLRDCLVNGDKGPDLSKTMNIFGEEVVRNKINNYINIYHDVT